MQTANEGKAVLFYTSEWPGKLPLAQHHLSTELNEVVEREPCDNRETGLNAERTATAKVLRVES